MSRENVNNYVIAKDATSICGFFFSQMANRADMAHKPINTLVIDTGAIIKNDPPVSALLGQCETIVTVPAIITEITDEATRSRVETTLKPFLTIRSPSPESLKFVSEFARKTGDLHVLSKPDIQIIALAYEIECERNNGDWRLRQQPGQKRLNGASPFGGKQAEQPEPNGKSDDTLPDIITTNDETQSESTSNQLPLHSNQPDDLDNNPATEDNVQSVADALANSRLYEADNDNKTNEQQSNVTEQIDTLNPESGNGAVPELSLSADDSSSDSDEWITPSNLKRKQAKDSEASAEQGQQPTIMQVAVLTTDFAMQNVILQMNLNLLSSSLNRVKQVKSFVQRCHACFFVVRQMEKQFCPRCGQMALTRVTCSTNAKGEFKLHLKKNMQWNHRGDRYSIPKPVHGSANGRVKGGGKGGWGNDLILAEDQKEYQKTLTDQKRMRQKDLFDEDYLPSILTGERRNTGGRIRVGGGRNINSKKR